MAEAGRARAIPATADKKLSAPQTAEEHSCAAAAEGAVAAASEEFGADPETARVLAEAEAIIAELSKQYLPWLKRDLNDLSTHVATLRPHQPADEALDEIFSVAHNIKGQGGAFGYPLVSEIADMICRLSRGRPVLGELGQESLRKCVEGLRVIADNNIGGDGGQIGAHILAELDALVQSTLSAEPAGAKSPHLLS